MVSKYLVQFFLQFTYKLLQIRKMKVKRGPNKECKKPKPALIPEWTVACRNDFHLGSLVARSTSLTGGGETFSSAVTGRRDVPKTTPRLPEATAAEARRSHEVFIFYLREVK